MLEFESVSLSYGSYTAVEAFTSRVKRGEVVALLGPNGAGKSTLIRAASGILRPARGRVLVDGEDLQRLRPAERARRVAVVPQAFRLPEAFTVLDTVLMGRTAYLGWLGRETENDKQVALQSMERTGISHLEGRRIGELSGGEQQLVLIARALSQSSPVLLLDEPTAHLDLKHQADILGLVGDLAHRDGYAVLLAMHELNLAAHYADAVALLAAGKLQALGSPRDVLTEELLAAVYGLPVSIFPHPKRGTPVIFPETS